MTNRLRLAALLLAALPLAGCGNKGPLVLAPQPAGPPPSPADVASDALAPMTGTVVAPAAATVSPPPDPTQSFETIAPPPASTTVAPPVDDSDDGTGTPR